MTTWNRRYDLYIDVDAPSARALLVSATDSSVLNSPPEFVAGDESTLRIHFLRRTSVLGAVEAASPDADSVLRFSGRALGVPSGSDLLFLATGFEQVEGDESAWEADLDLNTEELATFLAAAPTGPKALTCEIEVSNAAQTRRRSLQFAAVALPQVYEGQDTPTSLPTPEDFLSARAVRFDVEQDLNNENQQRARDNISAASVADVAGKLNNNEAALADLMAGDPDLMRAALDVAQDPGPESANELYVGTGGVRIRGVDADGRMQCGDGYFELRWDPDGASPERGLWRFDTNSTFLPTLTFSGTADRLFNVPDKDGTVALLSDCEISGEVLISASTVIDSTHMGKRLRNISGFTQGLVLVSPTTGTEGKSFVVDARTNGFTFSGAAPIGPNGAVATAPAGGMYVVRAVDGVWMFSGLTTSQVMLTTGAQTAGGQKTFTTSPISTGTPTVGTQMLNRDQSDARYARRITASVLSAGFDSDVNTTTYKTVPSMQVTLAVGTYLLDAILVHNGNASYATSGVKDRIHVLTGAASAVGSVYRVLDNAPTSSSAPNALASSNPLVESSVGNRSQTTWRKGVITVTSEAVIAVQIAQVSSVAAANTTLATGSSFLITPL